MLTRDDYVRSRSPATYTPEGRDVEITSLLQEAFEENPDRGLTRVVEALALLLASLHDPAEVRAYADTDASASRTR